MQSLDNTQNCLKIATKSNLTIRQPENYQAGLLLHIAVVPEQNHQLSIGVLDTKTISKHHPQNQKPQTYGKNRNATTSNALNASRKSSSVLETLKNNPTLQKTSCHHNFRHSRNVRQMQARRRRVDILIILRKRSLKAMERGICVIFGESGVLLSLLGQLHLGMLRCRNFQRFAVESHAVEMGDGCEGIELNRLFFSILFDFSPVRTCLGSLI